MNTFRCIVPRPNTLCRRSRTSGHWTRISGTIARSIRGLADRLLGSCHDLCGRRTQVHGTAAVDGGGRTTRAFIDPTEKQQVGTEFAA